MPVKIYWLHSFENTSRLGIMARPRGNEWLEEEILSLKRQGVQIIVSLFDRSEIYELGLEKEPELCLNHGIAFTAGSKQTIRPLKSKKKASSPSRKFARSRPMSYNRTSHGSKQKSQSWYQPG
jgi:hypothetical protein